MLWVIVRIFGCGLEATRDEIALEDGWAGGRVRGVAIEVLEGNEWTGALLRLRIEGAVDLGRGLIPRCKPTAGGGQFGSSTTPGWIGHSGSPECILPASISLPAAFGRQIGQSPSSFSYIQNGQL